MFEYKVLLNGVPVLVTRYIEDMRKWYRMNDQNYRDDGHGVRYYRAAGNGRWVELVGLDWTR